MSRTTEGTASGSEVQLVAAYRTALRRFRRRTEEAAAAEGLTPARYDLLLMIKAADETGRPITINDLCELLQLRQQTVTDLVKRAEAAGLIERQRSPHDGRAFHLSLSSDAEARVRSVIAALRNDRAAALTAFHDLDANFRASMPEIARLERRSA